MEDKDEEQDLLEPPSTAARVGNDHEITDNLNTTKSKFSILNPFTKNRKVSKLILPFYKVNANGISSHAYLEYSCYRIVW